MTTHKEQKTQQRRTGLASTAARATRQRLPSAASPIDGDSRTAGDVMTSARRTSCKEALSYDGERETLARRAEREEQASQIGVVGILVDDV